MIRTPGKRQEVGSKADEENRKGIARALGLGFVTGAADDDCSAIGTYASAGAQFGLPFLWIAPATFPMMFTVVYLSSKLGQVSGRGLFHVIRDNYSRWILWPALIGVLIGNTIEAAADLGGMAAALGLFVPLPSWIMVVAIAGTVLAFQILGSYNLIRSIFSWLALVLFAYVGSALLAEPELWPVLRGTFIPTFQVSREFLTMVVAVLGTALSAYIYTWQSNVEVEEKIEKGQVSMRARRGATHSELRRSRRDILIGMFFSNLIMYFIIMSTGAVLHPAGQTEIGTAAQAAEALRPLAGDAAGALFAIGIIAVGFLAVPVMTTGAAYDLSQVLHWQASLHHKPKDARKFYALITLFTVIAVGINFLGFNPMKALVYSGVIQGFSTPPLLLLIVLMTNNPAIMGEKTNPRWLNMLGWGTVIVVFSASLGLIATCII